MSFLTKDELDALMPAEMLPHTTPIPTQIISSDEYIPPQAKKQRRSKPRCSNERRARQEARLEPRAFFQSAAGMAAAFVAMNDTFGAIFDVSKAEAATPPWRRSAPTRSKTSSSWTCTRTFLRDDTRIQTSCASARRSARRAGTLR
jgi:hypothetical protein